MVDHLHLLLRMSVGMRTFYWLVGIGVVHLGR
jgi:hypothetical protein